MQHRSLDPTDSTVVDVYIQDNKFSNRFNLVTQFPYLVTISLYSCGEQNQLVAAEQSHVVLIAVVEKS